MTADETRWQLCRVNRLFEPPAPSAETPTAGEIFAHADNIESMGDGLSRLKGNVVILREQDALYADEALFHQAERRFELHNNVRYHSPQLQLTGEHMLAYGGSDTAQISAAEFYFFNHHASGRAQQINRSGNELTVLHDTTYSTCDPDDPDWLFRAGKITLNHASGTGVARDMSIRFKNVPVFYFPALSFPIDDRRKSGFLLPTIGDSDKSGFELAAPYYWNIAPQADATLTPHLLAERGLKLETEWRYLNRWSMNQLQLEYLDDERFGDSRDLVNFEHDGRLSEHWRTDIRYSSVSDEDYFDDFGGSLIRSSIVHLRQEAAIRGYSKHWQFTGQVLDFQTVDEQIAEINRPYRKLPSLNLQGRYPQLADVLDLSLHSNLTVFDHEQLINAERFDIMPRLSLNFGQSGWFVTPAASVRHTRYRLQDPLIPGEEEYEIIRTVPSYSLDSGLFFDRSLGADQQLLQTLEPRLFLLTTPYREQENIPVFDTRETDFSFASFFSENRFVGADRIGDTEQAAFALSSRLLHKNSGEEIVRASIGQIRYYEDRHVTLPGQPQPAENSDKSDVLAEIKFHFANRWSSAMTVEWNPERREPDKQLFRLRYQGDNRHIFNLAYRSRPDADMEQTDASFSWPITQRWSAVGRWNRSLRDDRNLERFAGLQYESCCYAINIVAREYWTEDQTYDRAVYFQLSLKGLTQIGDDIGGLLERGILGFKDSY